MSFENQFRRLASKWREETAFMSSISDMEALHSFQEIVKMGVPAVPFLLRELDHNPYYWFWPLQAITGANPVAHADRGDVMRMRAAWLEWGRNKGCPW
jgi:hypothetical protein